MTDIEFTQYDDELNAVTVLGDEGWVGEHLPTAKRLLHQQFEHVADSLRSRPGSWKHVAVTPRPHFALPLRTGGLIDQLKRAGCEVATRARGDGFVNIYARFPHADSSSADIRNRPEVQARPGAGEGKA